MSFLTIRGLPMSVAETLLGMPLVGPAISAVGFTLEMSNRWNKARHRWVQIIS